MSNHTLRPFDFQFIPKFENATSETDSFVKHEKVRRGDCSTIHRYNMFIVDPLKPCKLPISNDLSLGFFTNSLQYSNGNIANFKCF